MSAKSQTVHTEHICEIFIDNFLGFALQQHLLVATKP